MTIHDDSSNLYVRERYEYTDTSYGTNATSSLLTRTLRMNYDGDADHKDSATEYSYDTSTGAVLTQTEYGEVSGNADGTFSDTGSDTRTTTYTYATNTTGVVVPATMLLTDNAGATTTAQRFYYDNLSLGSVGDGNLTKEAVWIAGSEYAETDHTYNSLGLRLTTTDPNGNQTTYAYDSFDLYPATITNALSQATTYTYDYSSGQVLTQTDPNGNEIRFVFDGLDRTTAEYAPDPQTGSEVQAAAITYTDTRGAFATERSDYLDSSNQVVTKTYLDGFGRPAQVRVEAEDAYSVTDTTYNPNGTIASESLPYSGSGLGYTTPTTNTDLITTYSYDPLERVTEVSTVVGDTDTTFDQWVEVVTDALGNDKTYEYDAFGRLVSVVEEEGSSSFTTTYSYDALDNLVKIVDADSNEREIAYDGRGLRTSLEDLHDPADTSFGTWQFAYDAAGNLSTTTDPKSQVIVRSYDALHREVSENYLGQAGTEITYTYDSCTEGVGFMCSASSTDALTEYTYTFTGAVASETRTIDGTAYTTEYEYDRQGNQTLVTYPDDSEVRFTHNNGGQLETIEQRESGGSWTDIVTDFDYGAHGAMTTQVFANGATTTREYDAAELYRLTSISTVSTSTAGSGGGGAEHALIEAEFGEFLLAATEVASSSEVADEATEPIGEAASSTEAVATTTEAVVEGVEETEETATSSATSTPEIVTATTTANSTEPTSTSSEVVREIIAVNDVSERTFVATSSTSSKPLPEPPVLKGRDTGIFTELDGKKAREKANKKAEKILEKIDGKRISVPEYGLRIRIEDANLIPGGIEVFARAWDKNGQIGFGVDGSVDVERFRIFNPPVLIADKKGEIERLGAFDAETGEYEIETYRFAPKKALIEVLASTIGVKKEKFDDKAIVAGRVGNTTSIFYPDADPETSSVDGRIDAAAYTSWSSAHGATSGTARDDFNYSGTLEITSLLDWQGKFHIRRVFTLFDTSALGTDTISGATLSLYVSATRDDDNDAEAFINVYEATPAGTTALINDDFDQVGSTAGASNIDITGITTGQYLDIPLNSTGIGWIDGSGVSKFAMREGHDASNVEIAPGASKISRVSVHPAEFAGTTLDPNMVVEQSAVAAATTVTGDIQSLNYTYDAVGNILFMVDASDTLTAATTTYTYDDLYRLLSASTTQASSSGYSRTFSYDALGNITNKSDQGSYDYDGDTGSSYANPHAATQIGSNSLTYDENGNVLSYNGTTYTWDYNNRLLESDDGSIETTYGYDHIGQRVFKEADDGSNATTTHYVSSLYETTNGSSTKNIYAGDMLVATIEGSGGGALTYFNHLDHLGSTAVVTDGIGHVDQLLSYYPFGSDRIDEQLGEQNQTKRYTGHDYDSETGLNYMKARYQSGDVGRFFSQDPVAFALGENEVVEEKVQGSFEQFLKRPQMLNSYAYATNNPMNVTDPLGEAIFVPAALWLFAGLGAVDMAESMYDVALTRWMYPEVFTDADRAAADQALLWEATTFAVGSQLDNTSSIVFDTTLVPAEILASGYEQSVAAPFDNESTPAMLPSQTQPTLQSKPLLREEPEEPEIRAARD